MDWREREIDGTYTYTHTHVYITSSVAYYYSEEAPEYPIRESLSRRFLSAATRGRRAGRESRGGRFGAKPRVG